MPPAHNPAWVLGGYLVAVLLGGALLAPWLWSLAQHLAPGSALAHQPFRRYVDRSLLGLALLGLWPMARSGLFPGWRSVGLRWGKGSRREIGLGLAGGMASMAAVAALAIGFGAKAWNTGHPGGEFVLHGLRALGAAIAVSVMEEVLFRGMVFGSLRRRFAFASAAPISAVLFALVHFFRRPEAPASVGPWTGIGMLLHMLSGLGDPTILFPGLLTLGMIGWLLAWCRERTGALWLPLGLHAGWIFWFKSYNFLTLPVAGADPRAWWWGSDRLHDGWLTFTVIGLTAVLFVATWRDGQRTHGQKVTGHAD